MVFFKSMNYVMKQKICRHPEFLNSYEDLITLVKKLHSSLKIEGHLQTTTVNTHSSESINVNTAKWKNQKPTASVTIKVTSFKPSQGMFFDGDCNYCCKRRHKEQDCYKKKSDNTESRTLSTDSASGSNCVTAASEAPVKVTVKPKSKKGAASSAEK